MSTERTGIMEDAFVGPDDGSLFLELAEAYRAAGDTDRAVHVLRTGLESYADYAPGFALLGEVLSEAGRDAEAAVCFEQLLELDPSNAAARASLEAVAAALGRPLCVGVAPPSARQAVTAADADAAGAMPWETSPAPEQEEPPRPHGDPLTPAPVRTPAPGEEDEPEEPGTGEPDRPGADEQTRSPRQGDARAAAPAGAQADATGAHADELAASLSAGAGDSTAVALADLLVGLLEYRDPFFRGGTSMTRLLAAAVARELGLDEETVDDIALGAVLRDLGQIPLKGLIDKPGTQLGDDGRRKLERHVDTALELLESVRLPAVARATIRHHHERWDGGGYPDGLAGDAIPLGARIVAVADSFAAMIAARPHRLPKRVPAALEDVRGGAGTQYDPAVVDALVRVLSSTGWRGLRFGLRHHVLVVDPDETRAMVIATKLCSNGYLAEAAFTAQSARERLDRTRIAVLVVSAELPQTEEEQLLREVREAERTGMIPVLVTDAGVTDRIALLEAGADVCLGRGASFEELKATLEAFLRREGQSAPAAAARVDAPWAGLQGDIADFPLGWLMQVLNYDSRTAAVFLTAAGDEGAIYLERGNPRHAQTRDLAGEDAFRAMLKWPAGSFSVDPDAVTDEQTIRSSLMNLLLEQAVQEDHAAFFGAVKV